VLFAPLALFPQIYTGRGLTAGLVLTALPAGFALTALGDRVLPRGWSSRARATGAGMLCAAAAALLTTAAGTPAVAAVLLGMGLGVFIPANNATIMGAIPADHSGMGGGGLVNMSRGLGTALGVAVVTLCLHLAHRFAGGGSRVALLLVAVLALVAAVTGYAQVEQRPRERRRSR
jgi:MFS family permease